MNAGPDVERLLSDWLAEEAPTRAPDRILGSVSSVIARTGQRHLGAAWRQPMTTTSSRLLAVAAAVLLAVIGAAVAGRLMGPSNGVAASPIASTAAGPSTVVGALTQSFGSDRHAYSIRYPTDWTVTAASTDWQSGMATLWGDQALDVLQGRGARLVAASQELAPGQSADEWYVAYCRAGGGTLDACSQVPRTWSRIGIGPAMGYITLDGSLAGGGTINPGGPIFDAVVVNNGRGYEFTLDGLVDRASFDQLLGSITFGSPTVGSPPTFRIESLAKTFTSPLYGYSIKIDPSWRVTPATKPRTDPSSGEPFADDIQVTGTDSDIGVSAAPLGSWTWDELLAQLRANATGNVPAGCEGGDPTNWPTIPVGRYQGRIQVACNAEWVYVLVGSTVYEFDWGSSTFNGSQHLQEDDFRKVLQGVDFPGQPAPSAG